MLALLAGGCASLSERECRRGDWRAVGREDGGRGLPADELARHREACASHGVQPDAARYRAGHAEGLAAYCRPAGGYVAGRAGHGYRKVCAGAGEAAFLRAFERGRDVNVLVEEVRELRRRIADYEMAAMSGEYRPEDRTQMRFRATELERELYRRESELIRRDARHAREFGAEPLTEFEIR